MKMLTVLLALGIASSAHAAEIMRSDASLPDRMVTDAGAAIQVGGGAVGFTQTDTEDQVNTGGIWDVRGIYGTRSFVAGELAYVGSARAIDNPNIDGTLVSHGAEAAVRLNAPITGFDEQNDALIEPYAFGGVGWANYNVVGDDGASNLANNDGVFAVPVGIGVAGVYQGALLDLRLTYRPTFGSETGGNTDDSALSNVAFTASVGGEF
jgi:hypothetical protein